MMSNENRNQRTYNVGAVTLKSVRLLVKLLEWDAARASAVKDKEERRYEEVGNEYQTAKAVIMARSYEEIEKVRESTYKRRVKARDKCQAAKARDEADRKIIDALSSITE